MKIASRSGPGPASLPDFDPEGFYDEALAARGVVREPYAAVLEALGAGDCDALRRRVNERLAALAAGSWSTARGAVRGAAVGSRS